MPTMLGAIAAEAAARYGDTPAYVTPDGGSLSYAELDALSDDVARGLVARGVGPGDLVGLVLPSGPAYAAAYVAAAKIGAVTAGVNDKLSPPERRRCLEITRPALVLASHALAATTELRTVDHIGAVVEVPDEGPSAEILAVVRTTTGDLPDLGPDPDRAVAVVFTSGTTGEPKGAVFGERQLDAISDADGGRRWGTGGQGLASTSFAHLGYMTKLFQSLRGGGTSFLMTKWSAGAALEMVARHRITSLGGIPTQVALMLAHDDFETTDLSSVRIIAMGGGPATAALVRDARRRFGVPVVVRYTCTEAGVGVGTVVDDPPEDAEESVGRARSGVELTIRDENDRILDPGETGQVCLSSVAVMSGYYADPEATRSAFTADGAVRTGDLGFVDDRGRLHLSGRSKEMYVRGGYNVFPLEVEEVLADHPAVAHVAVAPRTDPVMGEIGVAVVVARSGAEVPTLASLRAHAQGRLATHKMPEAILITDELPRTAMEKIDRRVLAQMVTPR
jgi:acyl-CoA synthetase (AMP-forming)/AMP-acid ligase II